MVGNVETETGGRQVFGAVAKTDTDVKVLIRRSLDAVGRTEDTMRIPLILISHSGRSRSPIPVILITLFTLPEDGVVDSMTWCWTATTDG